MKFLKLLTLFLFCITLASCGDDDDGGSTGGSDTFWECTVDGETFRAEGLQAYATRFDVDNTIAVYGSEEPDADGYINIFIATKDEGKIGTYDLGLAGGAVGTFLNTDGSGTFISGLDGGSGTMEITKLDTEFVEGTFDFKGVDAGGSTKEITNGKFKVKFN